MTLEELLRSWEEICKKNCIDLSEEEKEILTLFDQWYRVSSKLMVKENIPLHL